jgi:Spy/CpxP family protein refolding chaperone
MRNSVIMICAFLVLICTLSLPVAADEHGAMVTPALIEEAAKSANITPDQMQKIMSFWFDNQKEIIKMKAELELKGLDLSCAMESPKTDSKAVLDLVKQMGDIRTKLEMAEIKFSLKVLEVLSPEQARKVKELMKKSTFSPGCSSGEGGPGQNNR